MNCLITAALPRVPRMGALTSGIGRRATSNSAEHRHTSPANLGQWKGPSQATDYYTSMSSHHEGWTWSSPFGLQAVQGSECVEQSHYSAPDHPCL